jgi:hypothetical protein
VEVGDLDERAGTHVIDVAVDGDALGNEGVATDALDVLDHGVVRVRDRQPVDEVTFVRARALTHVEETVWSERRGLEALGEEAPDYLVGEELHTAIGVMDDEPLLGAQEFVRDDQ